MSAFFVMSATWHGPTHITTLLGADYHHQLPASGNRPIYQVPLQQDIIDLLIIIVLDLHDLVVDSEVPVVLMKVILSICP